MNILNINMNLDCSDIHYNIVKEMNKNNNVKGRVFFPVHKHKDLKFSESEFVDEVRCLTTVDRYFYNRRNKILLNELEKTYQISMFNKILAHSLFSNGYLAMTVGKKYNLPYTVIITNTDMNVYFKKAFWLRNKGNEILERASKIVCTSDAYKKELLEKYVDEKIKSEIEKKCICIPFGIDEFWIKNRENKNNLSDEILKLLYVGKINKNKNILFTLQACKEMIKEGKKVKFTIIGDVDKTDDLKILNKLIEEEFVEYHRKVNFKTLLTFYRRSDIFIMVSHAESFGLVYAEAMSQGLPIIYTKGQGFDKQFPEKSVGLAVDSRALDELVSALQYISDNYMEMSQNAYEKSAYFSWENISKRFINNI